MSNEFFEKLAELNAAEVPFAVATVIKISGSVSAKTGAKTTAEGKRSVVVEKVEELTDEIIKHCLPFTSAGGKGGMESEVRSAGMAMSLFSAPAASHF